MSSITNDPAVLGGIVVIAIGLVKIVDALVNKLIGRRSALLPEERSWIRSLHEMHDIKDENGIPRWYVPSDWSDAQEKIVGLLSKITSTQEKTAWVLESVGKQLERLTFKIDNKVQ